MAEEKRRYFPTKPAVGGMPARDRRNRTITPAASGFFLARPLKSSMLSPAYPFASRRTTRPNAPRFIRA